MANNVTTPTEDSEDITISCASLGAGNGRSSAAIDNSTNEWGAALITLQLEANGTPSENTVCNVYLVRDDDDSGTSIADDDWDGTDAAFNGVRNAKLIGALSWDGTANYKARKTIDTGPAGPLGKTWGIVIQNKTGVSLSSTETDHLKHYRYYRPQIQ